MSDINNVLQPFAAVNGPNASTVSLAATNSSGNVALPIAPAQGAYGASGANPAASNASTQFACINTGSTWMFVAFGGSAVAATVPNGATPGSYPVAPTASYGITTISVPGNPTYVAAIMASSTGTLYCTPGAGKA